MHAMRIIAVINRINIYILKNSLQLDKNITSRCRIECSIRLCTSYRDNRFLKPRRERQNRRIFKIYITVLVIRINIYELKKSLQCDGKCSMRCKCKFSTEGKK